MAIKYLVLAVILILVSSRSYPTYKQCDAKWGSEQLGTSSNTICKAGCLMSSVSMALAGCGKGYNPSSLNTWLKGHGGYVSGDLFVWGAVNSLGLSYVGKVSNGNIAGELAKNSIVILNVHGGAHWVLATGMSGSTISVNDPGYSTSSYTLSEIVANNSGLYHFVGSSFLGTMIWEIEFLFNVDGKREKLMHADGGLIQSQ
jgi:hypothetical protein